MKQNSSFFAALVIGTAFLATTAFGNDTAWPQWRGPNRDGQFAGDAWPDRLDSNHLQRIWHVDLGPSYSGPIADRDRVYSTESIDQKFEAVRAFDRTTGNELWKHQWEGAISVPFFAKSNGDWIRSTPALDGNRLYVAGMRDLLLCLDAKSGREIWRKDFVKEWNTPLPDFGFVSSPLVKDDAVYVQAGASLTKLDKMTGNVLWRSLKDKGGMWGSAFSSPIFVTLCGVEQLVVQTRDKLAGINPASGAMLWEQSIKAFRGMNILTPVVYRNTLFTSTYGGKTIGFSVTLSQGKFTVSEAWKHKAQGYMSTPILIDGVAYTHLKSQRMMAIEIATGRELWTSDQSFGKYVSFVASGSRTLALDQRGILYLLDADKTKLSILDERQIADDETWAHLAAAGDQLFVRELGGLTAFRWSGSGALDATVTTE